MPRTVALTAMSQHYPPYINVTFQDDGRVRVTLRGDPSNGRDAATGWAGEIVVASFTTTEWAAFVNQIKGTS